MATGNELRGKVEAQIKSLAAAVDLAAASDEMKAWMDFAAKFHKYSVGNILLILGQRRDASLVKGYRGWQALGRNVRKGEKGIAILAPCVYSRRDEDDEDEDGGRERQGIYYKTVYVFDVSQTEGDPLPEHPRWWVEGDGAERVAGALTQYATARGIAVDLGADTGEANGMYDRSEDRIAVRAGMSSLATAKTLAHETAHSILHGRGAGADLSSSVREVEAEAVAYVVLTHFGFDGLESPNYIAGWGGDSKSLSASMDRVANAAREIIEGLEATG